jgi:hypothetical protein
MGMLEQAQADIKRIRTDPNGFTRPITFTKADNSKTVTVYGMHAKIHMNTTTIGEVVNGKKAHVSVSESSLTDLGYVTRNDKNECSIKDDKVTVLDSVGFLCDYIIREIYPDEAVGLLVCILGDFE